MVAQWWHNVGSMLAQWRQYMPHDQEVLSSIPAKAHFHKNVRFMSANERREKTLGLVLQSVMNKLREARYHLKTKTSKAT